MKWSGTALGRSARLRLSTNAIKFVDHNGGLNTEGQDEKPIANALD
jgi:ribosomal protein L28